MEFFDRKEEVIDIQLTQYGKHMLSIGKFKPTQYAFYDGDVTYDNAYASGSEQQSKSEERIKDVPRLKTQYVYSGIETEITKINKLTKEGKLYGDIDAETAGVQMGDVFADFDITVDRAAYLAAGFAQPAAEKNYSLTLPLGQSSISSEYYPAWDIDFLHGSASVDANGESFTEVLTGTNFKSVKIPQGEMEIRYRTYVTYLDEYGDYIEDYITDAAVGLEDEYVFPVEYGKSSTIQIQPDYLLLDVLEENVDFETENFDIEVFTVDNNGKEQQLYFKDTDTEQTTPDNVEWWFDVYTDGEIDPTIYCKSLKEQKRKNIFADQFQLFKCPEVVQEVEVENIYEVTLTEEDFEEPC